MPVYIDRLRDWGWRLGPSCHLIADTNEELHSFAARIGLKKEWFQKKSSGPHYDLTKGKRALAIKLGAIELEDKPFHEILKRWREAAVAMLEDCINTDEQEQARAYLYR